MNISKAVYLFIILIAIRSYASEKPNSLPENNAEIVLLQKFTGNFALGIYTALQTCLQEKNEKAEVSCSAAFKLFDTMKNVIKKRNIFVTENEADLFEAMINKYTAGPNYQKIS